MSSAPAPTKAVSKHSFLAFGKRIEVALYKKCEEVRSIDLHLYHEEDCGEIGRQAYCKSCGEVVIDDDIIKGIKVNGEVIEVNPDVIYDTSNEIRIVSCPTKDIFSDAIFSGTIMIKDSYELYGQEAVSDYMLHQVLSALNTEKHCALVELKIGKQMRKAVLLPNGVIYSLFFDNEVRGKRPTFTRVAKTAPGNLSSIVEMISSKSRGIRAPKAKVNPENFYSELVGDRESVS